MDASARATVIKVLVDVAVAGAAVFALWRLGTWEFLGELFSDREHIRREVEDFGPLAPAAYVSLLVAQAVLAPLPAPVVAFAGGYVFGAFWGFVLTWLGAVLGGVLCFAISSVFGREFVARSDRAKGLDRYMEEHGAMMIFVLRLIPLVSFDAISYAAGLTGIPFRKFLLATALGSAPGTFAFVYLGEASPGPGVYASLGGLAIVATVAYAYFRRNLGSRG